MRPQTTIEIWLPKENWNKRFRAEGGGGYAGFINYLGMASAVQAGYATASTDGGHHYSSNGAFGLNPNGTLNHQLIEDFGWRSLQELPHKAKALIQAYYGELPRYSYWRGLSTGGRQGLMAVQRFPEEYDGVLAGCPAINWENYRISVHVWLNVVVQQEVGHPIEAAKLTAANQAAVAACDAKDGVIDGLINDPRKCQFDPGLLVCKGEEGGNCLTAQEAHAIRKIWEGPRTRSGERVWFGLERGTELTGMAKLAGEAEHLRWTKQNPSFDWRTLKQEDVEEVVRESSRKFKDVIATDNPDLQRFRARGGKLLVWHGEADQTIPSRGSIRYFNRVFEVNGGPAAVAGFARLFLIPGFGHTTGDAPFPGTALAPDPLFDALVKWVEQGSPPERVQASQQLPGGASRTRPLCPYPAVARWKRRGSPDDASNFLCVDGGHDQNDFRVAE